MTDRYLAYLDLLESFCKHLRTLCRLAGEKATAVRSDNLLELDSVMRREQALSLAFRGLEQKKDALARELGLESVPLSSLADHFPSDLRLQAKKTVEALQDQYKVYHAAAEVARNTLECNLHEIEKFLAAQDISAVGPGYTPPPAQPPEAMKSDFRA